jgi:hypothetical protein
VALLLGGGNRQLMSTRPAVRGLELSELAARRCAGVFGCIVAGARGSFLERVRDMCATVAERRWSPQARGARAPAGPVIDARAVQVQATLQPGYST